jgi:hypothetical protein
MFYFVSYRKKLGFLVYIEGLILNQSVSRNNRVGFLFIHTLCDLDTPLSDLQQKYVEWIRQMDK